MRNRLLLTFFLFGVVPIFLIGLMLILAVFPFLGQIASERVEVEMDVRVATLSTLAQDLAASTARTLPMGSIESLRQRVPRLSAVVRTKGAMSSFPKDAAIREVPPQLKAEFHGLIELRRSLLSGRSCA